MSNDKHGEEFGKSLMDILNNSYVANGVGLGSELGLFDLIAAHKKPITSLELATAGNFKERYVREWLAIMATGKILNHDASDGTYHMDDYKAPYLTTEGGEKSSYVFLMQALPLMTGNPDELKKCFKQDGPRGISYDHYKGFHEWKSMHTKITYNWSVLRKLLSLIPDLIQKLEKGITVFEAGCSVGYQIESLAQHFPNSVFMGYDTDPKAINTANKRVKCLGLNNITFCVLDGCNLPEDLSEKCDFLFLIDVVHDVPYSFKFLQEIHRSLKPRGQFYMVDIRAHSNVKDNLSLPLGPMLYAGSLYHCMPVSLYFEGGEGLGSCWSTEKQKEYLDKAGFADITLLDADDPWQNHFLCIKPEN